MMKEREPESEVNRRRTYALIETTVEITIVHKASKGWYVERSLQYDSDGITLHSEYGPYESEDSAIVKAALLKFQYN